MNRIGDVKMKYQFETKCMNFVHDRQKKSLILFGGGDRCVEFLSRYFAYDNIPFICDNNSSKWGKKIMGIPVINPEELARNPNDYVVLITLDSYVAIDSITLQLKNLGISSVYDVSVLWNLNTFWRYDNTLSYKFHELNTYPIVTAAQEKIDTIIAMLSDDKSKIVYENFARNLKYNFNNHLNICEDWHDHYFSDNLFSYGEHEILVDGGAFDGADTIKFAKMLGTSFAKAYVFEPDSNNHIRCYSNIFGSCQNKEDFQKFDIRKAGLFNKTSNVKFLSWGNYGSRFAEKDGGSFSSTEGYSTSELNAIPTIALDELIPNNEKVTLIKLDVEGAEIEALNGMKRIIMEHKPKLALSIYHRIEDLWEIPLLIKQWVPEYKLYARHHSLALGDKVLFATI